MDLPDEMRELARGIAAAASGRGHTVAVAESITAGQVALSLAAAPDASEWFSGSVVSYRTQTKRDVLGVTAASIISDECARQMAEGVQRVTGADLVAAVTGVGGPDDEEGMPPGTVFICVGHPNAMHVFAHAFDGSPEEIVELAALHTLRHLKGAALELRR